MSTARYFGTDGVRGEINTGAMIPETLLALALATSQHLCPKGQQQRKVVIGKDTRRSGYLLEPIFTAAFVAMGLDVYLLGPLPSPAVAMLTTSLRADLGVMISASHNPAHHNGIKFFTHLGHKPSKEDEARIEKCMQEGTRSLSSSHTLGKVQRLKDALGRYVEMSKASFPSHVRLDGIKVVLDCAHGAAYKVAPTVLYELGADVTPLHVTPDGHNINRNCGALFPHVMAKHVRDVGAHIGIALDGDADRLVICDEKGHCWTGEHLLALIATTMQHSGTLHGPVVSTVIASGALETFLQEKGIPFERTDVGDSCVSVRMRECQSSLGGEPSGHILLKDAKTGDGLVSALHVLAILAETQAPLSSLLPPLRFLPQRIESVEADRSLLEDASIQASIRHHQKNLADHGGRLIIRASGTEALIRIYAEGASEHTLDHTLSSLVPLFQQRS